MSHSINATVTANANFLRSTLADGNRKSKSILRFRCQRDFLRNTVSDSVGRDLNIFASPLTGTESSETSRPVDDMRLELSNADRKVGTDTRTAHSIHNWCGTVNEHLEASSIRCLFGFYVFFERLQHFRFLVECRLRILTPFGCQCVASNDTTALCSYMYKFGLPFAQRHPFNFSVDGKISFSHTFWIW